MLPPEDTVSEVVQLVWSTMLGSACADVAAGSGLPGLTVSVDIRGTSELTLQISLSDRLARRLTAALNGPTSLELPGGELARGDVDDALREIASMVGGNLKGILPGSHELSAPRLESAVEKVLVGRTQWFACDGDVFGVTLDDNERHGDS